MKLKTLSSVTNALQDGIDDFLELSKTQAVSITAAIESSDCKNAIKRIGDFADELGKLHYQARDAIEKIKRLNKQGAI